MMGVLPFRELSLFRVGITAEAGLKIPDPPRCRNTLFWILLIRKFSENVPVRRASERP
jgi:hypothetical protein